MNGQGALAFANWIALVTPGYLLILARCVGLCLQAPIFGSRVVPGMARMGLAMALSLVYFLSRTAPIAAPDHFLAFVIVIVSELFFGLAMGFAASIIHFAIQGAGDFVAQAIGLTMISTMNPMIRTNSTPTGQIFYYMALTVFILMGGHLLFLGGFFQSYDLVPVGGFRMTPALWGVMIQVTGALLGIVIQLAMPAVIVVLLIDVSLGVIQRTTPQAQNLLDFIQSIKPGIGLLIVSLMIPNIVVAVHDLSEQMITDVQRVVLAQRQQVPPAR
ncbi:MAG TPA: flagellar biosynthetic protein FliR [Stenomitos sp.]